MELLQIEQFKEGLYGLRRGFSNRKQIVENHWKHWVLGNLVDLVTKYRKHHSPSSDEIIVIHQSSISYCFIFQNIDYIISQVNMVHIILMKS